MKTKEIKSLVSAFEEATSITATLVAFPIILLVAGFAIDKALSTTPLFIILGIISGAMAGVYRAYRISMHIRKGKTNK